MHYHCRKCRNHNRHKGVILTSKVWSHVLLTLYMHVYMQMSLFYRIRVIFYRYIIL